MLPFLGDALTLLTGTATTKDVNSIKKKVNQLIETELDRVDEIVQDVNNLYNLITSLASSLSYHQLVLHIRSVLANLQDLLSYIKSVSMHIMDYVNTATTGTLSPHILPIADLKLMLPHIEESLPTTMHLPVSSEDTLHFYRYLHTHVLIANRQFFGYL